MSIREARCHRNLAIVAATVASLVCLGMCLISGPAAAQQPKPKAAKPATAAGKTGAGKTAAGKPGAKKPAPTARNESDDEEKPAKREDPYLHVPVDESLRKLVPKMRIEFRRALEAARYEGGQQESLQTYLRKWVLPSWTLEENYHMLPKFRFDLRNELRPGKVGPPHTEALEILLSTLTKIVNGNFHPVVRFNALLAIGDLNEQESASLNSPPTPLPEAVPVLLNALMADSQNDPVKDALKVAALVGLIRHARLGFAEQHQQLVNQKVVPALLELARMKTPPGNRSADGHTWMRCQAIEVLALLRSPGPNAAVAKALGAIVADKKDVPEPKSAEMLVRTAAARALGNLDYAGAAGLNSAVFAQALAGLALDACARETAGSTSDDEEAFVARRRLRAQLHAVWIGFRGVDEQRGGVLGLAEYTADKPFVDKLFEGVQALGNSFDKKDIEDADLIKAIGLGATALAKVIQQRAGADQPAEEEAKPSAEKAKPVEKAEAPEEAKPVEQAKPEMGKPAEKPKPQTPEKGTPAEKTTPETAKPAEKAKPEAAKPAEEKAKPPAAGGEKPAESKK